MSEEREKRRTHFANCKLSTRPKMFSRGACMSKTSESPNMCVCEGVCVRVCVCGCVCVRVCV